MRPSTLPEASLALVYTPPEGRGNFSLDDKALQHMVSKSLVALVSQMLEAILHVLCDTVFLGIGSWIIPTDIQSKYS